MDFFTKNDEKPKTELEVLEELRDLKRRRAAYRGKKVHTDKKSYVEVSFILSVLFSVKYYVFQLIKIFLGFKRSS